MTDDNPLMDEESPTWALEKFREREPLVEEVIAASSHLAPMNKTNSSECEWEGAVIALEKAGRKLAEWKP